MVARSVRDAEVVGSNPAVPTIPGRSSRRIRREDLHVGVMDFLTLQLELAGWVPREPPPVIDGVEVRSPARSDIPLLGALYFSAYEPGVAGADVAEATADIEASFDGDYGELWPEASAVAIRHDQIVGAVLTVKEAPWDDTPKGPFIIELFVDREHRRQGIARLLISRCLDALHRAGAASVGLRVVSDNEPALRLYRSMGFATWEP